MNRGGLGLINVLPPNPLTGPGIEDIRALLRARQTLLVHFNTPMTGHAVGFPEDLRDAIANPQWNMGFSTITAQSQGPSKVPTDQASACGSVGIVVDLNPASTLIRICGIDGGSNSRIASPGDGEDPSVAVCERSFTPAGGYNEWVLNGAVTLGIFSFVEPNVFKPGIGDVSATMQEVRDAFPGRRLMSVHQGAFHAWSPTSNAWEPITYDSILGYPAEQSAPPPEIQVPGGGPCMPQRL